MTILQHPKKFELRYRTPIDPDDERWVYKAFEVLDDAVSIESVDIVLENCAALVTATDFGTITTSDGDEAENTWGIKITPLEKVKFVRITWRVTTAYNGDLVLGEQFDRTDLIPVRQL